MPCPGIVCLYSRPQSPGCGLTDTDYRYQHLSLIQQMSGINQKDGIYSWTFGGGEFTCTGTNQSLV